mmetsp:Transcript_35300/g.54215  ORF Transcript_35300/g.54215 Transcript_35300/m.54215 type:complete len:103 (+) Transcript_35300:484-792(+)
MMVRPFHLQRKNTMTPTVAVAGLVKMRKSNDRMTALYHAVSSAYLLYHVHSCEKRVHHPKPNIFTLCRGSCVVLFSHDIYKLIFLTLENRVSIFALNLFQSQ